MWPLTAAGRQTAGSRCGIWNAASQTLEHQRPPHDVDLLIIRSLISQTDTHLNFLDEEISRLRDRLEQLEEERVSLSRYHAQNKSILSPLRRIPPEVLAEILSWTLRLYLSAS
ncbi:hypothetical protein DFH07DRAFT_793604 [Mycena maculata]|uniref:Uncharacterized protein n=1 Tax=Mycena maculata TaxID=230809 RepID=A0AAD7NY88_9AGAR|nr:hypothetical protein DFH07DRAFT_793604 [Mycena maculata]